MELLNVIRRWHYRDHFSIREISRRTGLSRNTVRKYLRSDSVEPKFALPDRPSRLDPYADKLSHMLRQEAKVAQAEADGQAIARRSGCPRLRRLLQSRGGLQARDWKATQQQEQKTCGRGVFVPLAFKRAKRSSSTGRKTGRSSAESGPNCRSLTSSSPTAAPVLRAYLQHDEQAVIYTVELALEAGAPTKTHILKVLHRLVDGKPVDPPAVKPPDALTLTSEPQANVGRYDALRKAPEARHAS